MNPYYINDFNSSWGWFLWFGVIILLFSSAGNWGYTYTALRKNGSTPKKDAMDILNERYAKGDLPRVDYTKMKLDIISN